MQRFSCLLASAAFAAAASAQTVLPTSASTAAGTTTNVFPFGTSATAFPGLRISCVYDSTHFTGAPVPVTSPVIIKSIQWRANDVAATASWVGGTYTLGVKVTLATAAVDYLATTTNFAANMGPDAKIVHNGPVTVVGGTGAGVGVPGPYVVTIPIADGFLYNPNLGDLVVDTDYLSPGNYVGGTLPAMDVGAAATTLGRRVFSSSLYPVANGVDSSCPVIKINHTPAVGLFPAFNASPRTGPVSQLVNFTDQSYTSDPGGITAYAWDVDGIPGTDYTTQNPSHMYTAEGKYTVKLTVTSSMFGTKTLTRNAFVVIDAVDASFTNSILPGGMVNFTDTSSGNPTSWAWDFTNDGITDSTVQNPSHVYLPGSHACRLTVSDSFSNDTTTSLILITVVAVPDYVSTFASTTDTRGFWFQSPTRFSVVSARVPDELHNGTHNVAIYRLGAAPPVFPATASGGLEFVSLGQSTATDIPCVVSFDAGEFVGVLGACGTTTMLSSYGTPVGPFATSVLGQACTLTRFGTNINTTGGDHPYWQEPGANVSRVWLAVTACAAIPYGTGSPSGLGPAAPQMRASALPYVGQTATHQVTQNDSLVLQLMVGGFGRVSVPLSPFGTILIGSADLIAVMNGGTPVGPGTTSWSFAVPPSPTLVGQSINWQNANIVIPTGQWSLSNGIEWWINNPL